MIQASDRKIMMLQKMIKRLKRQARLAETATVSLQQTLSDQQSRITKLIGRLRGNGAKAPVSSDLIPSYEYTIKWVTDHGYKDKSKISIFKAVADNNYLGFYNDLKGHIVVDWVVEKLDDDLYDLQFVREWTYGG
jgi:hypothetical protein